MDEEIDYTQFDGNGDGWIDGVYLHFAGEHTGWASTWWSMTYGNWSGPSYDGMQVGRYVTLHQPSNTEEGARTLIHEDRPCAGAAGLLLCAGTVFRERDPYL